MARSLPLVSVLASWCPVASAVFPFALVDIPTKTWDVAEDLVGSRAARAWLSCERQPAVTSKEPIPLVLLVVLLGLLRDPWDASDVAPVLT
jgi:hypothetical protein